MINTAPKERRTVFTRLHFVMVTLLRSRRPVPARQIASEYEVSDRTIYRDIETLNGLGVEITGESSKGFSMDRCNCPFCGSQLKQN